MSLSRRQFLVAGVAVGAAAPIRALGSDTELEPAQERPFGAGRVTVVAGEVIRRSERVATVQTPDGLVNIILSPSTVFGSSNGATDGILRRYAEIAAEGRWEAAQFYATAVARLYRVRAGVVTGSRGAILMTSDGEIRFDGNTERFNGEATEPVSVTDFSLGNQIEVMGWREPNTDIVRAVRVH